MEEGEGSHAALRCEPRRVLHRAVTPLALRGELVGSELGVVDQQVGSLGERSCTVGDTEGSVVRLLVIAEVRDRATVPLDAVPERRTEVGYEPSHHVHRAEFDQILLDHAASLPGLWVATSAACARHWLATFPAATHLRLEPSIWQDYPGSLS